jgi:hypothetical protein
VKKNPIKIVIGVLFIVIGLGFIAGCTGEKAPHAKLASNQTTQLTGTWTDDKDPNQGASKIQAVIRGSVIQVTLSDQDTSALYWKGSFPKTSASGTETLVSTGDMKANKSSVIADWTKTKTFVYKDGELTFDLKMMGVTRHVHLQKKG